MSRFIGINQAIHHYGCGLSVWCGRAVAWLSLCMAVTVSAIVLVRSVLDMGVIGAQESVTYMHATMVMLASAYTLRHDGHVRVDIFYQHFSALTKAWLNTLGCVFLLLPVAVFIVITSWDYVAASWSIKETSADPGGLPAVFLLKTLLIASASLLVIQALAECSKNLLTMTYTTANQPPEKTPSRHD